MNLLLTLPYKTVFELSQVKIALSELSRVQYSSDEAFAQALSSAFRAYPVLSPLSDKLTSFDAIVSLKKEIALFEQQTPVVHVWVAYPLKPELIDRLSNALQNHYKQSYLLDIQHDPKIIGGIALEINGKYIDKTLLTITKEVMKTYV